MFTPIERHELSWIEGWLTRDDAGYVPSGYQRHVVVLHPGATVGERPSNEYVPVVGPSSVDGTPAPAQIANIATALIADSGRTAPANAALYDGVPDVPWPSGPGRIGYVADFVETNVVYALVGGTLDGLLHHSWKAERAGIEWVSMLWPSTRAWFLASDPDSAFTVIACGNELADEFLALPGLHATEVPDYRWDRT